MRTGVALALALVLGLALAGCKDSPGPAPTSTSASTTATTPPPRQVDGQAVYDWVTGVVTKPDGSPHYRVPGTADHAEAARWLAEQMEVPGWTVAWQNFTGADYEGLDKGPVAPYYHGGNCDAAERERLGNLTFSNLLASKPGPGRTFLLGAHWDSKRFATMDADADRQDEPVLGANDGASGVGVLLQLMHELADDDLGFGLQVILFDGEDGFEDCHPLAGSLWYVDRWERTQATLGAPAPLPMGGGRIRLLLLDMVGDPDARFIREDRSVECDEALVDLLHEKAGRHGLEENFPGGSAPIHDDHTPFAEAGIPAVDLIDYGRGFPPYWHTTHDTMENLTPAMLGDVASLVLDVLQDPSLSGPWPSGC